MSESESAPRQLVMRSKYQAGTVDVLARGASPFCGLSFSIEFLMTDPNSHARVSPPGTMREGSTPSSSFPIHHTGALGSSPVKSSNLRRTDDEEM